jgi:hypothetical protein
LSDNWSWSVVKINFLIFTRQCHIYFLLIPQSSPPSVRYLIWMGLHSIIDSVFGLWEKIGKRGKIMNKFGLNLHGNRKISVFSHCILFFSNFILYFCTLVIHFILYFCALVIQYEIKFLPVGLFMCPCDTRRMLATTINWLNHFLDFSQVSSPRK